MRTFIAIELPENIRMWLGNLQKELKSSQADVKWVEPKNIHLTLKFLGEIDEKKIEKIIKIMDEAVKEKPTFTMRINSIGAFPSLSLPRVIWVGLDKGENETKLIAGDLEEKIAKTGIPKEERPFSSHITLGRVRSNLNRENLIQSLNNAMGALEKEELEFLATKITLLKSTLGSGNPIYEAVKVISLKTT